MKWTLSNTNRNHGHRNEGMYFWKLFKVTILKVAVITHHFIVQKGDYIWVEPQTKKEFDVAIGARVKSVDGRKIVVVDDDTKVLLMAAVFTQRSVR